MVKGSPSWRRRLLHGVILPMAYILSVPHVCPFNGVFTPEQDNDKTKVEPVHSYDAFHTRHVGPGVKGIIVMHRLNICLVVVLLWCENTIVCVCLSIHLPSYLYASLSLSVDLSYINISLSSACPRHSCSRLYACLLTSQYSVYEIE